MRQMRNLVPRKGGEEALRGLEEEESGGEAEEVKLP